MRLALPLLAILALPACRTTYVRPAPGTTLEKAVARLEDRSVVMSLEDGTTQRVHDLQLTDSTLVFSPRWGSSTREVPRQEVLRLSETNLVGQAVMGVALIGAGGAAGGLMGVQMEDCSNNTSTVCGLGGLGVGFIAGAILSNFLFNPTRYTIFYDASRRGGS